MKREISNLEESLKQQHESSIPAASNSLIRGLVFGILFSLFGFAIPLTYGLVIELVGQANSPYANPPAIEWHSMFNLFLPSAFGCAILFALAAVLNYAPAVRLGTIRSLLFVGVSAIAGIIFMAVMAVVFNLEQQSYTSDSLRWPRILLALSIPCTYTFVHTAKRFTLLVNAHRQKNK